MLVVFEILLLGVNELFLNVSIIPTDSSNNPSLPLSVLLVYRGCSPEIRLP